ncbi:MAG TPA: ABC transporter permease [Pyrinomonadaceae bacterium]
MDTLLKDIRFGIRNLRRRPGFALVAIITLALGIGANTAIFTLIDAVLLKSLPVNNPEELVLFSDTASEGRTQTDEPPTGRWNRFSYDSYQYLRDRRQSFQDLTAVRSGVNRLSVRKPEAEGGSSQRGSGHLVAGNYFSVLGVTARQGRVFTPEDDNPAAPPVAVVSHRYWQQGLNSDPTVVGKSLILNGNGFTVVGITPPEFFGERVRRSPDFWLPLSFQPQIDMRASSLEDKQSYWLTLIGRLRPDVSLEQASAEVNLSLRQFLTEQAGSKLSDERKRGIENTFIQLASGAGGISGLRNYYSKPLRTLMVIVAIVLLIACANIGALLLSRAATRNAELSLRMALGATRLRIIRQLLTESLLLAIVGGLCGILLSQWGAKLIVGLVAKESPLDTRPDLFILLFTIGASISAAVLFGLLPAIRASRTDLASAMKAKHRSGVGRLRWNWSSALVVMQIGLSMVLLAGAGLFGRSLLKLQTEHLGFDRANVLLVSVDPRLANYKTTELADLYRRLTERVSSIPGIRSVSLATYSPMSGSNRRSTIAIPGYTPQATEDMDVQAMLVGPNYCDSLGIPLLQGREIGPGDTASSQNVVLINRAFAERFFKDRNPIGKVISFDDTEVNNDLLEVVGVIGDVKWEGVRKDTEPSVYRPIMQVSEEGAYTVSLQIRTNSNPSDLAQPVRQAIVQVDDKLPIFDVTTLREQVGERMNHERLVAQLVGFFGALALLLACVGLYGVMAHNVARRTNEIGIRMALGAMRNNIAWMVLRESFLLVAGGLLIGVPVAVLAARLISSQLYGLSPGDPLTMVGAAAILIVVALIASYVPARKASRVNPLVALRDE